MSGELEPGVVVVFGATGDLAHRSLFPALLRLDVRGRLPKEHRILGVGREEVDVAGFRADVADSLRDAGGAGEEVDRFVAGLDYVAATDEDTAALERAVRRAEDGFGRRGFRLFYLSIPPAAMPAMVGALGRCGLADDARLLVEKPFGHDAASACELFDGVASVFAEPDVYRVDHFLGLRSLHDLLALRATNGLLEPLWNREHVESVQIDVPEEIDIEGRASFMESTGTFQDMFSSHLLQVLGSVAMDLPDRVDGDSLRARRLRVFADLRPFDPDEVVFGQYRGYRETEGVADDSEVETFVAARAWVDSDRWSGVPFLLRSGKALAATRWAVTIRLRDPEPGAFGGLPGEGNEIVVALDDTPNIRFSLRGLAPGPGFGPQTASAATGPAGDDVMDPYERLLHDAVRADRTLFVGADEAVRLWEVCAPVAERRPRVRPYDRGGWGPAAAIELAGERGWQVQQ